MARIADQLRRDDTAKKIRFPEQRAESVWKLRRPQPTVDWSRSAATRYLCAAAHLDQNFREQVIDEYVGQRHRALVVPDGVDMSHVLIHALAADRRTLIRDLVIGGLTVVALYVLYSSLSGFGGSSYGGGELPPVVPFHILACFIALLIERWTALSLVIGNLTGRNFNTRCVDYKLDPELKETLEKMAAAQGSKAVIYSGFSPFVGCGIEVGGWSFALDATKGKDHLGARDQVKPVRIEELYDAISDAMKKVTITGAVVEDKLYVNGRDIADDRELLPNPLERPVGVVDPAVLQNYLDGRSSRVRYYKNIKIVDWDGELVLNMFLRFTRPGNDLFMEASYFLLTPLQDRFHAIDSINPARPWRRYLAAFVECALAAPLTVLLPIVRLISLVKRFWAQWETSRTIRRDPTFDYGAQTSVRERVSSGFYRRYFQKLDKEMYVKVIERQVLDTVLQYLDERNIDTSDLKQRQTQILNQGVIVSGGGSVVNSGSMAVGEQPRSTVSRIRMLARGAAASASGRR